MDSKILFTFVLAVNICIITVTAQVHTYKVRVRTADKDFDSQQGKLMLSVMNNYTNKITQEDFVLTPNDIEIKKDEAYTTIISSIAPLNNITSVYLRWTLASPYDLSYAIKKPIIYFEVVTLSIFTLVPHDASLCKSHIFRPEPFPVGIEHMDGATFNFDHDRFAWKNYGENANITVTDAFC